MKGKQMKIRDLEDLLNAELKQLDGRKYEGAEHYSWARDIIEKILADNGIQEMKTYLYWVTLNIENPVVKLDSGDRIASIVADAKQDRRIKYGSGKGTIVSMKVDFDDAILDMTLDEARAYLTEKKRIECLERIRKFRAEAEEQLKLADAQISELIAVEF